MKPIPLYDASAPIACTIAADEIPGRIELLERLRDHLAGIERTEHGLRLHFPGEPGIAADLGAFVVDEKRCCQFWGFAVSSTDGGGITLRWDGPPAAAPLLDHLHDWFQGDEPLTSVPGLL